LGFFRTFLEGKRKLFWTLAGCTFVVDQATKSLLWQHPGGSRPDIVLVPHVLRIISHAGNVKGALGLGPSGPLFYIIAAVVGLAAVVVFFLATDPRKALAHVALGMLAGGALGNMLDRIVLGVVRDFIDLHWGESLHWHTFNAADAAICMGFALIVYDTFLGSPDERANEKRRGPAQESKRYGT
jgi:signal peptidase II